MTQSSDQLRLVYYEKREFYVPMMKSTALELFGSADRIRYYQEHDELFRNRDDSKNFMVLQESLRTKCELPVLNFIKICTAFEMIFKAELLSKSYLVHVLKDDCLKNKQKTCPVQVPDVQSNFPDLTEQTIQFSKILGENYREKIGFEERLYGIISGLNRERNKLHLLPTLGKSISDRCQADYKFLIDWIARYRNIT